MKPLNRLRAVFSGPARGMSLQTKMILNHLLLLLLPIGILSYVLFSYFIEGEVRREMNMREQMCLQVLDTIDNTVSMLKAATTQPLYDAQIITILKENTYRARRFGGNSQSPPAFSFEEESAVGAMLSNICMMNRNVHGVFLFSISGYGVNRIRDNQLLYPYNPSEEAWFRDCLGQSGGTVFLSSQKYPVLAIRERDDFFVFSVARAIIDPAGVDPIGVIRVYADADFLRQNIRSLVYYEGERALLVDRDGVIAYDTMEENIGKTYADTEPEPRFSVRDGVLTELSAKDAVPDPTQLTCVSSPEEDLTLVLMVPKANYYTSADALWQSFLILILVFFLLSLCFSVIVFSGITRPLKRMVTEMSRIEAGDFSVRFPEKGHDEVGTLSRVFNQMMSHIDMLVNENHVVELMKKEAQINALQAQINPHFLYNTLEGIRMTSLLNGDKLTSNMVFRLGKLMRYSISNEGEFVTLAREVEHLQYYVELQNLRFNNKIRLELGIAAEHKNYKILRMTLQPLVENCIYHGFPSKTEDCVVELSSRIEDGSLVLAVWDNGAGMAPEQIDALMERLSEGIAPSPADGRGIGLTNVSERFHIFYGRASSLTVSLPPRGGLLVSLRIPLQEV